MITDEDIIDRIYEAALLPDKWINVLEDLTTLGGAAGTLVFAANDQRQLGLATEGAKVLLDAALSSFSGERNTRGQLLLTLPQTEFHSDADYFSEADMAKDPLYTELQWPLGLGYASATWIAVPSGDNIIISIERKRTRGPFERDLVQRLTGLRPHIARSAMLASKMGFEKIQTANRALQSVGMAAAAVRADKTVIDCNDLFTSRPDQIGIGAGNKLKLLQEAPDKIFTDCLLESSLRLNSFGSRSLSLTGTDTSPPAVLHLIPVRKIARDIFTQATFFVVVTPLGNSTVPPTHLIQGLFDLTTAEARVAQSIGTGHDVKRTASDLGLAQDTVRQYLKRIFVKTGLSRQSDLTAAIAKISRVEGP